ncbi:MAG TPA: hypothetical protein VI341_10430 [Actinomycetota bacterium]
MAIKSKKNRSKSKQVARAPRREPVPVPTPLLARRWVQVVAAAFVGFFAMMVLVWVTNGVRRNDTTSDAAAKAATRRTAATAYQGAIEEAVGKVGVLNPGVQPTVFPEMLQALQQMQKGEIPENAASMFDDAAASAGKATAAIVKFNVAEKIRDQGFDSTEATLFTSSAQQLSLALQQFQRCAQTGADAVAATEGASSGTAADDLLTITQGLCDSAQAQLSQAWGDYQAALQAGGIVEAPAGAGEIPGLGDAG